jgi:hypothetical protein
MVAEALPADKIATVRLLPRGDWMNPGEVMQPAFPEFLAGKPPADGKRLTRLDLANWLMSAENPLPARQFTNRLWQQFFGRGLSSVLDDLGSQGEMPSHPELLDWLASEFRESGWDVKHMVRLVVTSSTYQREAATRPAVPSDPGRATLLRAGEAGHSPLHGGWSLAARILRPKPQLNAINGKPFPASFTAGQQLAQLQGRELIARGSFTKFKRYGQSGVEISELFPHIGSIADDICVIRSMVTEQINHDPAHAFMNTGSILKGRPSMGSWLLYGLGAETQNLPVRPAAGHRGSATPQRLAARRARRSGNRHPHRPIRNGLPHVVVGPRPHRHVRRTAARARPLRSQAAGRRFLRWQLPVSSEDARARRALRATLSPRLGPAQRH